MSESILIAFIAAFLITAALYRVVIPLLKKFNFGQYIREEGPQEHFSKAGTPTMGGFVFLAVFAVISLLFVKDYERVVPVVLVTIGYGLVGFADDFLKIKMKRNLGLKAWQKILAQLVIATVFITYIVVFSDMGTAMTMPFTGKVVDIGWLYIPFSYIVVLGTVNGANLTDGIDGLSSSVTLVIAVFFAFASALCGGGFEPAAAAMAGGLLGYMVYNVFPARVFMGDTGSLAMGGFVAACAYMIDMPLIIVIAAFIYLAEAVSVILQVGYFKATGGKRLFKMAPIHHHFEKCGHSEPRITAAFFSVTIVCCLIAYMAL